MAKLIDKIKVGMSMKEVRAIIPYKPYSIIPESPMDQKTGHTRWIYLNSTGSLEISFENGIYTGHVIRPNLAEIEKKKLEEIKKEFPYYFQ